MNRKEKLNQPYYTEPVEKTQSNLSDKTEDLNNHWTSEVFPPRGSFINIPEDVLFTQNSKSLNSIIEDKNKTIGSDLYKNTKIKNRD